MNTTIEKSKLYLLQSPLFLLGLVILIVNDHVWKYSFPGPITGILSDISGLFIFPIFWGAIFPRYPKIIYLLTALGFVFWNSIWSEPLVMFLRHTLSLSVGRTVDPLDFPALLVLPLSYLYFRNSEKPVRLLVPVNMILLISGIAFSATTCHYKFLIGPLEIYHDKTYNFGVPKDNLERELKAVVKNRGGETRIINGLNDDPDTLHISYPRYYVSPYADSTGISGQIEVNNIFFFVVPEAKGEQTNLHLIKSGGEKLTLRYAEKKLLRAFKDDIVRPIRKYHGSSNGL